MGILPYLSDPSYFINSSWTIPDWLHTLNTDNIREQIYNLLSDDESNSNSAGQRFPDTDFVKFDELFDGTLSYKSFNYAFSKVDSSHYICTTDDEGNF